MSAVMPNSLPAPLPKSAIPGATNPKMINGIIKERKLEKIPVIVTNILTAHIGKNRDAIIPTAMAMITFASKPNRNFNLIVCMIN